MESYAPELQPAAERQHLVQFYEGDPFLIEVVAQFVIEGFSEGEPAVVIATAAHREALRAHLLTLGVDAPAAEQQGRLWLLDAKDTLSNFLVGRMPDWDRFRATVEPVLREALAQSGASRVRAFGEMVDLLVRDDNAAAALLLEEYWDDLGDQVPFVLLCSYRLATFQTEGDTPAFLQVCSAHSHVAPTERYADLDSHGDRLREIALLQQRAAALEAEVAYRKRVEVQLREALRTRDDFLSVAGHELRTPLTALQLQLHSVLNLHHGDLNRVRHKVERARAQADRLAALSNDLLDVARLTSGKLELHLERLDLAAVAADVVERLADAAASAGCHVRLLTEQAVGEWDRLRVEQVVTNLLANALKYGAKKPVDVWVKRAVDRAVLVVRDQGIGISLEDQARVFERFERAINSRHFGGLGLGLWIARHVVQSHRGLIHVQSAPDRGATFTVELPLSSP